MYINYLYICVYIIMYMCLFNQVYTIYICITICVYSIYNKCRQCIQYVYWWSQRGVCVCVCIHPQPVRVQGSFWLLRQRCQQVDCLAIQQLCAGHVLLRKSSSHRMEIWQDILTFIYIHTYIHALHCIALHCIALHYITLHYITLHYIHIYIYIYTHHTSILPTIK